VITDSLEVPISKNTVKLNALAVLGSPTPAIQSSCPPSIVVGVAGKGSPAVLLVYGISEKSFHCTEEGEKDEIILKQPGSTGIDFSNFASAMLTLSYTISTQVSNLFPEPKVLT
jgi:hypothetical protein